MNLVNQMNDLSTEKDFFELTPPEWWETKFNNLSLLTQNSFYQDDSERETIYNFWGVPYEKSKTNRYQLDYSKPKKEFTKQVNKWKKMNFIKKYEYLEKNNLLNINFNDIKYVYKMSLKNQLKKLAEEQAKEKPKKKRKKLFQRVSKLLFGIKILVKKLVNISVYVVKM